MTPFAAEAARCRAAHLDWSARPSRDRVRPAGELRYLLAGHAADLAAAVQADTHRSPDEVIATDILPAASACRFAHRNAVRVLRPRRVGRPPLWLLGCRDTVHHRPHGVVGVIGTWNYPIFLNVVPILHALVAGNGVLWKPSEHAPRTAELLHDLFGKAGFPPDLLVRLPADRESGPRLAEADVDLIHFTGSDGVGRRLAARLGERLVPSVLELSGCDAVAVLADANLKLAARSAWYAATLNAGQTCMAVRRALVHGSVYERFVGELRPLVAASPPMRLVTANQIEQAERLVKEAAARGCEVVAPGDAGGVPANHVRPTVLLNASPDLAVCRDASFAPLLAVVRFDTTADLIEMHDACPFGLAAAVFTANPSAAADLIARLRCGSVVVNDAIVPTANPATPFGGRRASGWGLTQGEEGLLQMTVPQVVSVRRGTFRPHVDAGLAPDAGSADVTRGLLRLTHGRGLRERWCGLRQMVGGMMRTGKPGHCHHPRTAGPSGTLHSTSLGADGGGR